MKTIKINITDSEIKILRIFNHAYYKKEFSSIIEMANNAFLRQDSKIH